MISVIFRYPQTGWAGLAFAQNKSDLFWMIDQHGDPYGCEIKTVKRGSFCFKYEDIADDEDITTRVEGLEVDDYTMRDLSNETVTDWVQGTDYFRDTSL